MSNREPTHERDRDQLQRNSFLKDLRRLLQDGSAYRKQGRVWIEGDHLCRAYLQRGLDPDVAVYAESYWLASAHQPEVVQAARAGKIMVVKDVLWRELSPLDSPAPMGFVVQAPARPSLCLLYTSPSPRDS